MRYIRCMQWLLALAATGTVGTALSSCQNISGNELATSIAELTTANDDKETVAPAVPEISSQIPDNTPEGVVNMVMDAINQDDAATLAKYMAKSGENPIQAAEAAIADYKTYFLGSRLVGFHAVDESDPASQNTAESLANGGKRYELITEAGLAKEITVVQQADQLKVTGEFLDYSGMAKAKMSSFVGALQNRNAEQLAAALSTPQRSYSTYWAERAIANYQNRMNLDTVAFEFVDLNSVSQEFTYNVVSKAPEGYELEHYVTVTFGNGQVSIQDPWLP